MSYGQILMYLLTAAPQLVKAIQDIMASDAAHTIESAMEALVKHNTKGEPNSPALT